MTRLIELDSSQFRKGSVKKCHFSVGSLLLSLTKCRLIGDSARLKEVAAAAGIFSFLARDLASGWKHRSGFQHIYSEVLYKLSVLIWCCV